jgi:hypothetical protein
MNPEKGLDTKTDGLIDWLTGGCKVTWNSTNITPDPDDGT